MRRTLALLMLAGCLAPALPASGQRTGRAPAPRRPAPRKTTAPAGTVVRLRCWSERPGDCAALAERLAQGGTARPAPGAGSGWTRDLQLSFRRASAVNDAAAQTRQAVDDLRAHRFRARVSLQSGKREWLYLTDDTARSAPPHAQPRLAQGTLARVKEQSRAGDLELALTGAGGKVLKGTDQQVDGVVRNLGTRPVSVQLARGCDLEVAVTQRGSDRRAALSPCAEAPETIRIAAADSFVFRGADVPSDATGSFNAYGTLLGTLDGRELRLRTKAVRIEFRKAGRSELADWTAPRPDCSPAPLPRPGKDELPGAFLLRLGEGVDAEALARFLARERRLDVAVATPRYLRLRGSDEDAAGLACLGGVEQVLRDVAGKRD